MEDGKVLTALRDLCTLLGIDLGITIDDCFNNLRIGAQSLRMDVEAGRRETKMLRAMLERAGQEDEDDPFPDDLRVDDDEDEEDEDSDDDCPF